MKYYDIADMDEDQRITSIGNQAMRERRTVAFITDSDPGKADRYITKLKAQFPGIVIIDRGNGPVADTVYVKVGPPPN